MYENAVCAIGLSHFFLASKVACLICTNIRSIHVFIPSTGALQKVVSAKTTLTFSLIHNYTIKVEHKQKHLLQFHLDIILCISCKYSNETYGRNKHESEKMQIHPNKSISHHNSCCFSAAGPKPLKSFL